MYGLVSISGILLVKSNERPEHIEATEDIAGGWYVGSELYAGAVAVIENVPNKAVPYEWQLTYCVFEPIPLDTAMPEYAEGIIETVNELNDRVEVLEQQFSAVPRT